MKTILSICMLFACTLIFAQTTVTGTVVDDSGQPIPGANIIVSGTSTGTITDFDGGFSLTTDQSLPFTLTASSIGFESADAQVTSNNQVLSFALKEGTELDEIVISALEHQNVCSNRL